LSSGATSWSQNRTWIWLVSVLVRPPTSHFHDGGVILSTVERPVRPVTLIDSYNRDRHYKDYTYLQHCIGTEVQAVLVDGFAQSTRRRSFQDLLRSCARSPTKLLSCRTFTSQKTSGARLLVQALIREEQEIARWLDRQTLEYRSRVHHQSTRTTIRSALQRRLLDESRARSKSTLISHASISSRHTNFLHSNQQIPPTCDSKHCRVETRKLLLFTAVEDTG
jgi:hypothetical protein